MWTSVDGGGTIVVAVRMLRSREREFQRWWASSACCGDRSPDAINIFTQQLVVD